MLKQILLWIIISLTLSSCKDTVNIFEQLDTHKDVKIYFLSSEIMGPNNNRDLHPFQTKHRSFYIDDKASIQALKKLWQFKSTHQINHFTADYFISYTENGVYRGKISIDLVNGLAVSGYGPSEFDLETLQSLESHFKPLDYKFIAFDNLESARQFYNNIKDKQWLLPSENDEEFYMWTRYNGECIVQVNNKDFARDKDIKKAFEAYMPKRFPNTDYHYNIFRFTAQNSSVRICSMEDLSNKFPKDFKPILPWQPFKTVILPLVNYDNQQLEQELSLIDKKDYRFIDKIE